jgi:hypothetical protein
LTDPADALHGARSWFGTISTFSLAVYLTSHPRGLKRDQSRFCLMLPSPSQLG